jgi:hypothetical protein
VFLFVFLSTRSLCSHIQLCNYIGVDRSGQVKSFPDIWSVLCAPADPIPVSKGPCADQRWSGLAPRQILYRYRKARAPINVHLETRTSPGCPQFPPSTFEIVNRPPEVTNSPRRAIEPYYIFPSNGRPRRNTGPDPISAAKSHVDSRKSGSFIETPSRPPMLSGHDNEAMRLDPPMTLKTRTGKGKEGR